MSPLVSADSPIGRQLHKFGGSSLADVKCYQRVAGIMAEYSQPGDLMVVSAAGSSINQLISWLMLSQGDRLSAHQVQQNLRRYQSELINGLLPPRTPKGCLSRSFATWSDWRHCLTAPSATRSTLRWSGTVKSGRRG